MIKNIFISLTLIYTTSLFALDDFSFSNKDRYDFLKISPIGIVKDLVIQTTFYPPEGKKLNHASYVKIWEKKNKEWNELDEITPDSELGIQGEYHLSKKVHSDLTNAQLAIEIEFIHCNSRGGQCAMERYLGKIPRSNQTKNKNVKLTLRVK